MGKFIVKKTRNKQFMFNLKAENGEIILTSETYFKKQGALRGIASVKKNCMIDSNYKMFNNVGGNYYFHLKANNNEIIGASELYTNDLGVKNAIESIKENAPLAPIIDKTTFLLKLINYFE